MKMGLKEMVKKDIDELRADELVVLSEQIRLLKRARSLQGKVLPLEEIQKLTASSKSTWSDDIVRERQERG